MKKIVFALIALAMVLNLIPAMAQEETKKEFENYARYAWNGTKIKNMTVSEMSEGSHHTPVLGGERTIALGVGNNGWTRVILNVDDTAFEQKKPTPVAVTVRYWDDRQEGSKGEVGPKAKWICLRYTTSEGAWKDSTPVYIGNSKEFKEYTWQIDDFVFSNAMNSADLWIVSWTPNYRRSGSPMYVSAVEIKKCDPMVPLKANGYAERWNGDQYGNMYSGNDEKKMNLELLSILSRKMTVSGSYEIYTSRGERVGGGEIPRTELEAEEKKSIPIELGVTKYGCYEIRFSMNAEYEKDGQFVTQEIDEIIEDFSVTNKLSENEKKNPAVRLCGHSAGSQANGQYWKQVMNGAAAIGVSGLRESLEWEKIEPSKGRYLNFRGLPHYQYAKEIGMDHMLTMMVGHRGWGKSEWGFPSTKSELEMTTNFLDWFFKNYGSDIPYFEYWNEPNLMGIFNSTSTSATEIAEIMKLIYPVIKKNSPDTIVNGFSTAQIDMPFLEEGFKAGLLDYCDSLGVHPYDWDANNAGKDLRDQVFIERCTALRELCAKYGHPETRIDMTELGIRGVSEDEQAGGVVQLYGAMQYTGCADSSYYYDYANDGPRNGSDTKGENRWGWVYNFQDRTPLAAKPAYVAMGAYNHFLSDAVPVDEYVSDDKLTRAYRFKRNADGKDVIMLWTDSGSSSLSLNLGTNECEIFDMYSNSMGVLRSGNNVFDFITSFEPIYITGDFTCLEYAEPEITVNDGRIKASPDDFATFIFSDKAGRNISVNAKAHQGIEITSQETREDGSVAVTVKTKPEAVKTNQMEFEVYDGNKLLTAGAVHVDITKPLSVSAAIGSYGENGRRLVANTVITNLTNAVPLSGVLTADMTAFGGGIQTREFYDILPGESASLQLHMPNENIKRTSSISMTIKLDYGYEQKASVTMSGLSALYTNKEIPVRGQYNVSDWSGGEWFAADDKYSARNLKGWGGKNDCSLLGTVRWDEENLYILGIVSDNVFFQNQPASTMWQCDSIQLGVCEKSQLEYVNGICTQLGIGKIHGEGDKAWVYPTQTMYNGATNPIVPNRFVDDCDIDISEHNGKWIYRCRINWKELFGEEWDVTKTDGIGFSIMANDNDGGGRRGWVEFCSGIGNGSDQTQYGLLKLVK